MSYYYINNDLKSNDLKSKTGQETGLDNSNPSKKDISNNFVINNSFRVGNNTRDKTQKQEYFYDRWNFIDMRHYNNNINIDIPRGGVITRRDKHNTDTSTNEFKFKY